MAPKPTPKNDLYRPTHQEFRYIYKNSALYDTQKILADLRGSTLNYSPCSNYPTRKVLSFCDIDHEYNWDTILPIVEEARDARASLGNDARIVFPDWLAEVFIVVFPNDDWRVILGQDRLQVTRLLGEPGIDVNVIRDIDMERYRIQLSPVVPDHLKSNPRMRIVTRPISGQAFKNPGNSDDVGKLITSYVTQLLRLQVMFEASGYTIDQARTRIEKLRIPLEFTWGTFDNQVKKLPLRVVDLTSPKRIKDALLSDPDMDRRKNPRAWKTKSRQVCQTIIWLCAALGQAREMQKTSRFLEQRLRTDARYRTRADFLTQVALRPPEENGEEISLVGLTRIAMLSAVNPADLWLAHDDRRHELEFAAAVGCLSNLQPALLKPATAQAAGEIYRRARTAPASCTEEQLVATMLVDRLEKTCVKQDFVDAARFAMRNREPVLISLADDILPSRLVVEPQSELLRRAMNSDTATAAP